MQGMPLQNIIVEQKKSDVKGVRVTCNQSKMQVKVIGGLSSGA